MASRRGNAAWHHAQRTTATLDRRDQKGIPMNRPKTNRFPDGAEQVQVILTKPQAEEVKKVSARLGVSQSELLRRVVDHARQPA